MIIERMSEDDTARKLGELIAAKRGAIRQAIKPINIRKYLKFCADLYRFSYDNQMIMYANKPDASCVAGINAWKKAGRKIKDGEDPIYVFVDVIKCESPGVPAVDADGVQLVLSDSGIPVYDKEPVYSDFMQPVPVYDISQTEPIDNTEETPVEEDRELPNFLEYIDSQALIVVPVDKMDISHKYENAYYDPAANEIIIKRSTPEAVRNQELLHAYVQFVFTVEENMEMSPSSPRVRDSKYPDIAVECITWILNEHFGLKQTIRAFGDLSVYDNEDDVQVERDLRIISFYAQRIIQHLERFPLTFEETSLLNTLMYDDDIELLDDLYHRLENQFDIPDDVKSSITHIFEAIVTEFSDNEREKIFKDRLHKEIMSHPPYYLKFNYGKKENSEANRAILMPPDVGGRDI